MKRYVLSPMSGKTLVFGAGLLLAVVVCNTSQAYERYSSCAGCHGAFDGPVSTKGTVFPNGDKHRMHRNNSYMAADCNLCHKTGDGDNPFIGDSNGTANNPGIGCNGCHLAAGLRAHHEAHSVTCYDVGCHGAEPVQPETFKPTYYGTADTKVDNPCNDVLASNTNENWSINDFLGLDNDGDNLYDLADFDCGPPYQLVSATPEGNNVRITWETVGGRIDAVQASADVNGPYSDVSSAITNPGVGLVTTNFVEVGGAAGDARFYRVRSVP